MYKYHQVKKPMVWNCEEKHITQIKIIITEQLLPAIFIKIQSGPVNGNG